jgi:ribonuclease VapC
MVLDTSAIVAILAREPEATSFNAMVEADSVRLISAATLLEASIVIEGRFGTNGGVDLDNWIMVARVQILPVDAILTEAARRAWRRFGKGRHPAGLNFGDCFSYALATARGEPLLFKGDDFSKTDVQVANL